MPASAGITTRSPITIGEARLARKVSPFSLRSEVKDSVSRTWSSVPEGTVTCSGRTGGTASAEDATDEALTGQTLVLGADEFESGAWMSAGTGVAGAAVVDVVARWSELAFAICDIVCVTVSGCATEGAATAGTLPG